MIDFQNNFIRKKELIDLYLKNSFSSLPDSILKKSAEYSTNSRSKRLRAILILSVIESTGISWKKFINLAGSIEFLHTATLIHDDLPCMDNSDMRRGLASNHKKFTESISILTGDFLFSYTFYKILNESAELNIPDRSIVRINKILFKALNRIIIGQAEELSVKGTDISEEKIMDIIKSKTASFIEACVQTGGIIAGLPDKEISALTDFGACLGIAFQLTDDIIDIIGTEKNEGKNPGTDIKNNICTLPGKSGLNYTINLINDLISKADKSLKSLKIDTSILKELLYLATEHRLEQYKIKTL